ncbi:polar amino acid transport system substrate-binding protein [Bradyrhizobium sp. i1.4.4]
MLSSISTRVATGLLAVAFSLGASAVSAQGAKNVISAATITTYPPYEYMDPASAKLVGFDIDIVEAIAANMGAKVNWIESSFAQLISFVPITTKRVDIIASGIADTPERRNTVSFLDYIYDPQVFFTLRANGAQFPNMEALCGKRVAVTRSSVVMMGGVVKMSEEVCVKTGKPAMVVIATDGAPQSRLELNQGRADLAVQGAGTLVYQNSVEDDRYVIVGQPAAKPTYGIAFAKDDLQFGEALKKAFAEVIADGTYHKILRKWNMPDSAAVSRAMINGEP